ncbi:zf-HC2 domain-containing protein [Kitasatospora atroaurantiaca]|uniref:Putative zinc finger protein n=1 Tax=Kitasatospora atroaurantiaca TaxID=285545 RepID=A0A561EL36_9ACTN|nr:zf-HC2 domain-containing protein [Kitasatospora atroaurantiaca]TWE16324.1 putative zinc finger protein [Kitasatospora atroaurantiaca]
MTTPQSPRSPEPSRVQHVDVGAYVLGVLDPADRLKFQEHLDGCARCAAEVEELGSLEPLLAELAVSGMPAAEADPVPKPSEELLGRLVGEVSAARRRSRTRRLVLVAAAAVLIVGGPAVTAALTIDAAAPQAVAAQQFSATDPLSGTSATVGVEPKTWGSQISLSLSVPDLQGPVSCDLVAVSRHGERQTVTTWSVPQNGYAALRTTGGSGLSPTDIDHFEVRTLDSSSRLLVSVPGAPAAS